MDPGSITLERMRKVDRFHRWLAGSIAPYLGKQVLEVGCGTGNCTDFFLEQGREVIALEPDPAHLESARARFAGRPFEPVQLDIQDPRVLSLASRGIDTVVCINVLEHVEDDRLALSHMRSLLAPGGRLILYVPAHPFLFSSLDRALHHYRRYTKRTLLERIEEAGFRLETLRHMNLFGILGWFVQGKLFRAATLPEGNLILFNRLFPVFEWIERISGPPIGLSLLAVAGRT